MNITFEVASGERSREVRDLQFRNMAFIFVVRDVSKPDKSIDRRLLQLSNISEQLCGACAFWDDSSENTIVLTALDFQGYASDTPSPGCTVIVPSAVSSQGHVPQVPISTISETDCAATLTSGARACSTVSANAVIGTSDITSATEKNSEKSFCTVAPFGKKSYFGDNEMLGKFDSAARMKLQPILSTALIIITDLF